MMKRLSAFLVAISAGILWVVLMAASASPKPSPKPTPAPKAAEPAPREVATSGPGWYSAGLFTKLDTTTVLADTGPFGGAAWRFDIFIYCTLDVLAEIQQRDATDTTTIHAQRFLVPATTMQSISGVANLATGERLRLTGIQVGGGGSGTGQFQGSVFVTQ